MTVGITGGIGSGKSVVSRVLRCNGYNVYDCDYRARKIMNEDADIRTKLTGRLGKDIYDANEELDRKKLAAILFSDPEVRAFVNNIVHEAVRIDIKRHRETHKGYFFIESAILAGGGIAGMCDEIWVVTAPESQRIERVMKRDGLSPKEIEKRIASQQHEMSLLDKNKVKYIDNGDNSPMLSKSLLTKLI